MGSPVFGTSGITVRLSGLSADLAVVMKPTRIQILSQTVAVFSISPWRWPVLVVPIVNYSCGITTIVNSTEGY